MPDPVNQPEDPPLRSISTASLPTILADAGISLLVSTYQRQKVVIVRADSRGGINTHFRSFDRPMGIAVATNRVAVGSALSIHEFHNVPAVAAKVESAEKHDAVYLPRSVHYSGDVQIHEMAFAENILWFVNTRFSCLCTRDLNYSFVPKWKPPFVSVIAAGDRCHLNGLAVVDGQAKYVTALGATDVTAGWRANKASGGVVMDIQTNQIVADGLSMPHSPRWHDGRLWVCSSGTGTVGTINLATGAYQPVVQVPGFTRGLSFHGRLGFVGLSQVRETAQFSGIPIADKPLEDRACGVWIFDIHTGAILAFLRFEQAVQEVFAMEVLPHRYPDLLLDGIIVADSFVMPPR